ncbi:hypothetical protein Tco_0111635 [Tanacetum coccineum]
MTWGWLLKLLKTEMVRSGLKTWLITFLKDKVLEERVGGEWWLEFMGEEGVWVWEDCGGRGWEGVWVVVVVVVVVTYMFSLRFFFASTDTFGKKGRFAVLGFGSADVAVVALSFDAGFVVGFRASMVETIVSAIFSMTSCGGVPAQSVC